VYWNEKRGQCEVCMGSASLLCGYEYMGEGSRLVHTPSTERAFFSIITTLRLLNLGRIMMPFYEIVNKINKTQLRLIRHFVISECNLYVLFEIKIISL
jgi:hypothetical protein